MKTYICKYIADGKRLKIRIQAYSFVEALKMASIIPHCGGTILSLSECPVQQSGREV